MPRVGKERRLRRQARLERQRAWLAEFWGSEWGRNRQAFLLTVRLKPGMSRQLRRMIVRARAAAELDRQPIGGQIRTMSLDGTREWTQDGVRAI